MNIEHVLSYLFTMFYRYEGTDLDIYYRRGYRMVLSIYHGENNGQHIQSNQQQNTPTD